MTLTFPSKMNVEAIANKHKIIKRDGNIKGLPDIESCRDITEKLYENIVSLKNSSGAVVMPAEEWLVDNYHIVSEQFDNMIMQIKRSEKSSFRGIPVVRSQNGEVLRVYDIARYITELNDARVDENCLKAFLDEYQTVSALTSAEICSLGDMLRISLLVKISEICDAAREIAEERKEAETIFFRLNKYFEDGEITPADRKRAIDVWVSNAEELTPVMAETVLRLAASENGDTTDYRLIFDMKLAGRKTSVDRLLKAEQNTRIALGITMGNAVRSLIALGSFDWDTLSLELSAVERILDKDPCGVFTAMDRDSRGYYIRCTENIARRANVSAVSIAMAALEKAKESYELNPDDFKSHVGYYICDDGVAKLSEKTHRGFYVKMPKHPRGSVASAGFMACSAIFTAVLTFITAVLVARTAVSLWDSMASHIIALVVTVVPSFIVYMNISVNVIQTFFAKFYKPVVLPSMNYDAGLPKDSSVFFVMPVLMKSAERVKEILDEIEVIYLANRDENIYFAVLADAAESDTKNAEWDSDVYETGVAEAERLNAKYGFAENKKFFFLYRPRVFHNCENKWLGRERKRGALIDFNNLVSGRPDHNLLGMTESCPKTKYVFTVDADTRIPNGAIRKMAAICAHPLNRPCVVREGGCAFVKRGYGILQPAVMTEPIREGRSPFAEIYTGDVGIDSYFARNSDFYFDVCSEGIYTGKGMYSPEVFNEISEDTFRDETVLSHDLLEGSYMRTAFTSNIMIFDGFPTNYIAYIKRQHRWIRGDWQLLPYKKDTFINRKERKVKNPLNFISLYKMTNNLQRSLGAPSCVIVFLLGMIFMPEIAWLWHMILLGYSYYQWILYPSAKTFKRCSLNLCTLPHEAYMSLDAIVRTLWRINVSHKHLLSWVTAADAEKGAVKSVVGYYKYMWPCVVAGLLGMSPLSILWLASPMIIFHVGEIPAKRKKDRMLYKDQEVMALCRRMWAFYEDYAPINSFLPPDNVQFKPEIKIAERTSPTNIGFFILCTAHASHLGFITLSDAVWTIEQTIKSIKKMEMLNGHLLNWYNTKTLEALRPMFVSTVDSGNMAVCMITAAKLLGYEQKRIKENPSDVIKSRFFSLKTLVEIIKEDSRDSDGFRISFPENFDGTNIDDWKVLLKNCIDFCEKKKFSGFKNLYLDKFEKSCRIFLEELKQSNRKNSESNGTGCMACDISQVADKLNEIAYGMDFSFLFDRKKGCFATGFSVKDNRLSNSHYDIAVSEARLSIYFAIAKGDVSAEAFFRPARRFLDKGKGILRAWSGTAFEYLLPELFFRAYPDLLWDRTIKLMIDAEQKYGMINGVPWGISESGYNMRDVNMNYCYKAFGVPKLAISSDCCDGIVIAPYASLMAMGFAPEKVKSNLSALKNHGVFGKYGFFEAIDFSDGRKGVVESYMAHHVGMAFTGCVNYLDSNLNSEVFSSVSEFRACELLLAEKCHKNYGKKSVDFENIQGRKNDSKDKSAEDCSAYFEPIVYGNISAVYPAYAAFSGKNSLLTINEFGDNALCIGNTLITCEKGLRFFIRECNSGKIWSATVDSGLLAKGNNEKYRMLVYPERAIFCRDEDPFSSELHLCVSGDDGCVVFRLEITNGSLAEAMFEVTVFTEIAVSDKDAFYAHRSYSDINTVTSADMSGCAVLFADKVYRSGAKADISAFMSVWADKEFDGALQFDTDTVSFSGRGIFGEIPSAVSDRRPLRAKVGAVITPCFATRARLTAMPGETVVMYTAIGAAVGTDETGNAKIRVKNMAEKYRSKSASAGAFDTAYTNAVIERERLKVNREFLQDSGKVLKQLFNYPITASVNSNLIEEYVGGILPGLWKFGISGNNPIIFAEIKHSENRVFLEDIIKMWMLFHYRGVETDLVICVDEEDDYMSPLFSFAEYRASMGMCNARSVRNDLQCGIYVLNMNCIGQKDMDCLQASAAVCLLPAGRKRIETVGKTKSDRTVKLLSADEYKNVKYTDFEKSKIGCDTNNYLRKGLYFENGYGGFAENGQSYVICGKNATPAPWINCITSFNGKFGFTVSESGNGFVWYLNSHEFRLTPWESSPAHSKCNETIFVRNENNGKVFSMTDGCIVKHGFGFSEFESEHDGLASRLTVFAHSEFPLKISIVEITNKTPEQMDISMAYFVEPVMGEMKKLNGNFLGTRWNDERGIFLCENRLNSGHRELFAGEVFICSSLIPDSFTGDAEEFWGNEYEKKILGGIPASMCLKKSFLSDKAGFGTDCCMAIKNSLTVKSGSTLSVVYMLAACPYNDEKLIDNAVINLKNPFNALGELEYVRNQWKNFLGTIEVSTPDKSFDFMVNGWLLYQVKSCRLDGRSALYQSGGAYGFRDQLQDSVALLHSDHEAVRNLILLCASRQYEEGDVQHWWHPPENKGVRTHCSDDLLWLVYAVHEYVKFTDDTSILFEQIPFLKSEPLRPTDHDRYELADTTDYTANIFEHCRRAIDHSMRFGKHGLPLMGGGDWNDGMNKVGDNGGESVWLGWFLCKTLSCMQFLSDKINAGLDYRSKINDIAFAIEHNAWENDRYLRAFYGDGTPLGSVSCKECEIDSISQSWSVLSGIGSPERSECALNTAYTNLVDSVSMTIRLLSPAFSGNSKNNPGYISDYPAGIRENGAQYTHAAIWLARAFYETGNKVRGYELLSMLNPINHSRTEREADIYKTEPYVMPADVYYGGENSGRGGWTWYTGSAGWYYRLCVENLLGITRFGNVLYINPNLPAEWHGKATVKYHFNGIVYDIDLSKGKQRIILQ